MYGLCTIFKVEQGQPRTTNNKKSIILALILKEIFYCEELRRTASEKLVGAKGGTRTHTLSLAADFESAASTNSATLASGCYCIGQN